MFDDTNKKILVEHINSIIDEAVEHGGDSGGAYCTNREGLLEAMRHLHRWLGLKPYIIVETDIGFAYSKPVDFKEE